MSSALPGCSVVIIAYNSGYLLPACLHSIQLALQDMDHQILVLDNGSPEPLDADFAARFPDVEFLHSDTNLGFGKACNTAARKALHPYLFFVNPDTLVSRNTFRSTLEFTLTKPDAGLVGCRILNGDGSIQWACRRSFPSPMAAVYKTLGLAALFPNSKRFGAYNLTYLDPDQEAVVDAISGSFFCVSRALYEQIGGFDEAFFMYGEDLDICLRSQQAGRRNYYFPGTSIVHFKGQSSRTRALGSYVNFYHAMLIFARKHRYYKPIPVSVVSVGIFFAALLGLFSRLLSRWWKMLIDLGVAGVALYLAAILCGSSVRGEVALIDALAVWLPLLVKGEYSTHRMDSRHLLKVLLPSTAAAALVNAFLLQASPAWLLLPAASFALVGWRRALVWGTYFWRVFTGRRCRALLLGSGDHVDRWFNSDDALPGHELLGSVAGSLQGVAPENRVHLLGSIDDLSDIRSRTGFRELIVIPDRHGRFDSFDRLASLSRDLRLRIQLLVGKPDAGTFLLVDLNYLNQGTL